ncbi:MAG: 4Fe-4S cluster-binding domain-containing protein [Euryarchaeota archaeon]|nr:4Fe-4S cluster-binding domain-containing protein [Euryarchaeota archaeon]
MYKDIIKGEKEAQFLLTKRIRAELPGSFDLHNALLAKEPGEKVHDPSLLDLKIALSEKIFTHCTLCERKCKVNRKRESGFCQVRSPLISTAFPHHGEEKPLVPSGTIFFSGCNAKCIFCQNWDISQQLNGKEWSVKKTAEWITQNRKNNRIINANFVGGEPTPNLVYILKLLRELDLNIPIIWNSNFYMSKKTMKLLDGVIDLYLSDFKYGIDKRAVKYSHLPNYWATVTRNHRLAYEQCEMIIRILVLPGKWIEEDLPKILTFIEKELPNARVNLMGQYRPEWRADEYPELSRRLTRDEWEKACNIYSAYDLRKM